MPAGEQVSFLAAADGQQATAGWWHNHSFPKVQSGAARPAMTLTGNSEIAAVEARGLARIYEAHFILPNHVTTLPHRERAAASITFARGDEVHEQLVRRSQLSV